MNTNPIIERMFRNPIINIDGYDVLNIGDPHLGKKWNNAFPDKREFITEHHWSIFTALMLTSTPHYKVIMGDIFDKSNVEENVLLRTYDILKNSKGKIYILEGNHDSSKTSFEKTSFDVLEELCQGLENVHIIRGVETTNIGNTSVSFIGWQYQNTIAQQIEKYLPCTSEIIYTHLDFETFSDNKSNVIPFHLFSKCVKMVINGHEHLPKRCTVNGIDYVGTGSMLPFDRSQQDLTDVDTCSDLFFTVKDYPSARSIDWANRFVYYHTDDVTNIPEFEGALGVIIKKMSADELETGVILEIDEISIPVLLNKAADITGLDQVAVRQLIEEFAEVDADER